MVKLKIQIWEDGVKINEFKNVSFKQYMRVMDILEVKLRRREWDVL